MARGRDMPPSRAEVPFFRRMWVRLALASTALVLVAMAVTVGSVVLFANDEIRATVRQCNEQVARTAAGEIAELVSSARGELERTAALVAIAEENGGRPAAVALLQRAPSRLFESVDVLDRRDIRVEKDAPGGHARFEPTALSMAEQGLPWMSPVDVDGAGRVGLTFVQPAAHGLALFARMPAVRIWGLVEGLQTGTGGFAAVAAEDGTLVAAPSRAAVVRGDHFAAPARMTTRDLLLVSAPIESLDWRVYIGEPVSQAYLASNVLMRKSLVLVVIALSLAGVVATLASVVYSRPLDALLLGTVRIAEGDFEHRIDERASGEFGLLSRSFNDMVRRLRERTMALEDSEWRYRHVTESVRDIIFSLDAAGRLTFVNTRVETLLGVKRETVLGKTIQELVSEQVARFPDSPLAGIGAEGFTFPQEIRVENAEGSEVVLELEGETIGPGGSGELHGIARDVTNRRRMEEKLRRSEKLAALGEVASRVAHELRNAVAGITASMERARARNATGDLAADLDLVLSEALRAQDIVQGLLGSARPTAVQKTPCSMNDALLAVIELRRGRLEANGIAVRVDPSPYLPSVAADPGQLRQVLHNLVDNAERALGGLPERVARKLHARTWSRDGRVLLEISDTGPGISPQDIGRIFDPFFTTESAGGGTGLGLTVSLAIIESFGGDIGVRSTPGMGAAFTIELPEWRAAAAPSAGITSDALAGARILVVEDEPAIREFVRAFMENMGCIVDSASNGQDAVAFLANGASYALVVSDFKMPDRDGRDLYEWIRASRPTLLHRLIYITGDSLNTATMSFLQASGVPYLLKPVVASVLADAVMRTVRGN